MINCTLHRANADRKGWGFLASSGPSREAAGGGTFSFVFTVPEREDTAYAFGLVYLSPTGRWEDGTRAATTKYMPYVKEATPTGGLDLRKTPTYRYPTAAEAARIQARAKTARPPGRPSVWVHPVLGAILLAAAAACAVRAGRLGTEGSRDTGERAVWLAFAVLLVASAAAELTGVAGHVTAWGRRMAEGEGVYELRRPFQKTVMAATAAALFGLFLLFIRAIRRPGSHRPLWWAGIGLAAYLAVSLVSALSFHAVDVARSMLWHGLSPVDAVRGAGATAALLAGMLARRSRT